ncbi:DUF3298 and DUF4163 domain-containing protein [Fervidobacterium sp.]
MEKNVEKRLLFIGVLFIFAIASYVLTATGNTVELVETKSETETVTIYVQIPKLQNTKNSEFENYFNSLIQSKVREIVDEVKKMAESALNDGFLASKYEVHISTEIKYETKDFVSLAIYYYTFTGGAHGNTIIETYNIDLVKSKFLSLKDIFYPDCEYQRRIKEEIIKSLTARSDEFFPEAIEYVKNQDISEQPFTITNKYLEIYYQDYEIAPHSTGLPVFEIPKSLLKDCLRVKLH